MALFERTTTIDPASPAAPLDAYKEGRRDERRQIEAGGLDHRSVKKELDDAFGGVVSMAALSAAVRR